MGGMAITRAVPRVEFLMFHERQPDKVSWHLQCGRAYERAIRNVVHTVDRKQERVRVRETVRTVETFSEYADFERHMLAQLGPNATSGRIDATIAKAARAWRSRNGA